MADIEDSGSKGLSAGRKPQIHSIAYVVTTSSNSELDRIQPIQGTKIVEGRANPTVSRPQPTASRHLRATPGSRQAYLEEERKQRAEHIEFDGTEMGIPIKLSYQWTWDLTHGDCIRNYRKDKSGTPFLVLGLCKGSSQVPQEYRFSIRSPEWLFWQIWWNIVLLRGFGYLFSLKDVQGFKIYNCNSLYCLHEHLILSAEEEVALSALHWAYHSGAKDARDWTTWIKESLNEEDKEHGLSIGVILGWSPIRISIVVLTPVILSLAIGIWFQSRNPTDLVTVQTAWGIATYIVTTGTLVAGLLAVLSGIGNK